MADAPQTTSREPNRYHDMADVTLPDGADYRIYLRHWLGTPGCPAQPAGILVFASSAEPYDIGASLSLTPGQARDMAAKLIEAADAIDGGWE